MIGSGRDWASWRWGASWIPLILLSGACATTTVDVRDPGLPAEVRSYLLSPLEGWTETLDAGTRPTLMSGFEQVLRSDTTAAMAIAAELLDRSPGLEPALVLAAQADFVAGRNSAALSRLSTWVEPESGYTSAALLLARLAELGDDFVTAYAAYRSLDGAVPVATTRAPAIYERAMQALARRLQRELSTGRLTAAQESLARMRSWEGAGSARVLEGAQSLARATGDGSAELAALRSLSDLGRNEGQLVERLADLELEIGDPERGLELLDGLSVRDPENRALELKLTTAQVRWRLRLLPDDVQTLADRQELRRGDYAALLYWLVPGVRRTGTDNVRIATDILDHERRQEIVRVLNRGLMSVDPTLHQFEPDRPVARSEAIRSLLEMLRGTGAAGECARELGLNPAPSASFLCGLAHRCGILDDISACLPGAALSGGEAVELLGQSLSISQRE